MKKIFTAVLIMFSLCAAAQVKVGQAAPEISLPNTNGVITNLSSYKGKVVLLDFWASWCGPCRRSNPGVVKLYNKYKGKGFEVFGVSIDSKKNAWLKAIQQDGINYTQVNDNGGWDAATALKYGVDAIPATFLLNKEGVVVALNAEGQELEKKISELIKQ
jgi:peroxiredoxin